MRWIAIFEDPPSMQEVRAQYGQAHLDYLQQHQDEILLGGGLREAEDTPVYCGGMWVFGAVSKARAEQLIQNDPYFVHGNRRYRLLYWGKAFEDVMVTL